MARAPKEPLKLNDDQRSFIVVQFAQGMSPSQVAREANEAFGLNLTRQAVAHYHPASAHGARYLAARWRLLYEETRARFLLDVVNVPIAHRNARLKQLQIMFDIAESRGNIPLAASLLKQAAEEVGNLLTNERKHHHSGKVELERDEVSEEEMQAFIADRLAEAFDKKNKVDGKPTSGSKH